MLLVSSELEELAGVADRVAILTRGAISAVLDPAVGDALSEGALLTAIDAEATVGGSGGDR